MSIVMTDQLLYLQMNFRVKVEDEYTYFAKDKPLVDNAKVRLLNYQRGVDISKSTADEYGYVTFEDITEDRYELYVSAPKHRSVKHVICECINCDEASC